MSAETVAGTLRSVSPFPDVIVWARAVPGIGVLGSVHYEPGSRPRPARMRSRAGGTRSTIRRPLLHRRPHHPGLLPSRVSGEARQVPQRGLLSHGEIGRAHV